MARFFALLLFAATVCPARIPGLLRDRTPLCFHLLLDGTAASPVGEAVLSSSASPNRFLSKLANHGLQSLDLACFYNNRIVYRFHRVKTPDVLL